MDWVQANWFWILIFGLFIAMHLFGHGGHGGHGGGHQHSNDHNEGTAGDDTQGRGVKSKAGGHQH